MEVASPDQALPIRGAAERVHDTGTHEAAPAGGVVQHDDIQQR